MVCLSYGGTCQDQPAFTSLNKASVVVWWVGVLTLLVTLGIGVACIVVGASYCPACCDQDWISTWHIFFGVVTVVFVVMLVYKVRDYNHLDASWVAPQEALVLPIAVLAILLLSAIFVGYLWLAESREEACSGSAPCSSDLTTFSVVVIVLLSLPLLVFFYVTAAVGLLTAFFVILSFIYYCSGDAMHQEVKILHEK
nr:uncharacterized protein LOC128694497 [Cherax quadricarinatus]